MPYLELTRGYVAIVDDSDFECLSQYKWHAHKDRSGIIRPYRHITGTRNKSLEMSRHIMGVKDGFIIDHVNRNTLDCRRENLRWATLQQNSRNRIKRNLIAVGVFKNGSFYSARITIAKGIRKYLGMFRTPQEANLAYQKASMYYFGEFSPFSAKTLNGGI